MSFEQKGKKDLLTFFNFIINHDKKDDITNMFVKGPPQNKGFMWCGKEGGKDHWWSEREAAGLSIINEQVLGLGWDSSGYGIMMRMIQKKIKDHLAQTNLNVVDDAPDSEGGELPPPPEVKRNLTCGGSSIFRSPDFDEMGKPGDDAF